MISLKLSGTKYFIFAFLIATCIMLNMGNDFSTPALYFFSTVAQTMGAVLGIVLAALYAIFPLIQQRNNQPCSDLLVRLLRKDSCMQNSLKSGFTTILLSIISLFLIYLSGNSSGISIFLLFIVVIPTICIGIICFYNITFFVINRLSKYSNVQKLYSSINFNKIDFTKLNSNIKHDYLELMLLADSILHTEYKSIDQYSLNLFNYDFNIDMNSFLNNIFNDISLSTKDDDLYHLTSLVTITLKFKSKHRYKDFDSSFVSSSILAQYYFVLKNHLKDETVNKTINNYFNYIVRSDLRSLIRNNSITDKEKNAINNEFSHIFIDLTILTQKGFRLDPHTIELINCIMFEIIEKYHNDVSYNTIVENYVRFAIISLFHHYKEDSKREPHQYERVIENYIYYLRKIVILDSKYIDDIAFFTYSYSDNLFDLNTLIALYYYISKIPPNNCFSYIGSQDKYALSKYSIDMLMFPMSEVGFYTKEDTSHEHDMRVYIDYFKSWRNLDLSKKNIMPEFNKIIDNK